MNDLFQVLLARERRGSKPRCHLLTHGSPNDVAGRLTQLAEPYAQVSPDDRWMPQGFLDTEEAQLHKASRLLNSDIAEKLLAWWLARNDRQGRTPNFDIASTCTIAGKSGLLLVEAKAHEEELIKEAQGRRLEANASEDRKSSHATIGEAISAARNGLSYATGLQWRIDRDSHYQMSNRFAWAWKLTELGFPVVLVYLGFLRADEMTDRGKPFAVHSEWDELVRTHSASIFPGQVWGKEWVVNGQQFIPLIRSLDQPLEPNLP